MLEKIRFPIISAVVLSLTVLSGLAFGQTAQTTQTAETLLPQTTREMQTPGFWIARHPSPDELVLDPTAVARFNQAIRDMGLTRDLLAVPPTYSGQELKDTLIKSLQKLKEEGLTRRDGLKAEAAFFDGILDTMAVDNIPAEIPVRYGAIVHYADQRVLPVEEGLYAGPGDFDFDELQNSALDLGEPVLILHESADGRWVYVLSKLSDGWMKKELVAFCERNAFEDFLRMPNPVIATDARADIYLDGAMTRHHEHVRMGMSLPAAPTFAKGSWTVMIPFRDADGRMRLRQAHIPRTQATSNHRPYTPRIIIEQAFKLLHHPYGWGGMYGGQDCSRFLQEVFASVGIQLPRNSKEQQRVGRVTHAFDEEIKDAMAGSTLLGLKGHIMLYLGEFAGEPYAIHSVWAYRKPSPERTGAGAGDGEETFVINKVTVSGLDLGEGSLGGSWRERIISMNHIIGP
jgi:hypothetical protein